MANREPLHNTIDLNNKYPLTADLKRWVIDTAVDQINEHSPLNVSYEQIKTGRKVTHIHFKFKEKLKSIEHKSEQNNFYKLTDAQINMFGNQLSRLHELSHLAQQGESYDDLAIRIKDMLRDPIQQKQLIPHLKNLGFKG